MSGPASPTSAEALLAAFRAASSGAPVAAPSLSTPLAPAPVTAPTVIGVRAPETAAELERAERGDPKAEKARRARFVAEFMRCGRNSVEAARRAGYARPSVDGPRVVRLPSIQAQIRERTSEQLEALDATPDRVTLELARIAFRDPRKAFTTDEAGVNRSLHPADFDDDIAAAVKKIKIGPLGTEVEFESKGEALALLTKIHGMQQNNNTVTLQGQVNHVHAAVTAAGGLTMAEIDELLALAPAPETGEVIDGEIVPEVVPEPEDE